MIGWIGLGMVCVGVVGLALVMQRVFWQCSLWECAARGSGWYPSGKSLCRDNVSRPETDARAALRGADGL